MTDRVRIVQLLIDELDPPDNLIIPRHDAVRSVFISRATGLALNERPSYVEWLSYRDKAIWMDDGWEANQELYSYFPYLENSVGKRIDKSRFEHSPVVLYAVTRIGADNKITIAGVTATSDPVGMSLIEAIVSVGKDAKLTMLNVGLVPLEMITGPKHLVDSAVFFWWNELKSLDWSETYVRIDTLVYWSHDSRNRINQLIKKFKTKKSSKKKHDKQKDTPQASGEIYHTDLKDVMLIRGFTHPDVQYLDHLNTSVFLQDLRRRLPELPENTTINDVSYFFSTGRTTSSLGEDRVLLHNLNAILCTYPRDIQDRLALDVGVSLDPRKRPGRGASIDAGGQYKRAGERLFTYEYLRQPGPERRSDTR